jgi:hypothetical protein
MLAPTNHQSVPVVPWLHSSKISGPVFRDRESAAARTTSPQRQLSTKAFASVLRHIPPKGSIKRHRFVRAETHPSKDDAVAFAIVKGKQIIDEQGERIFG